MQGTKVLTSFNIEAEAERQAVNEPITREYSAEVRNNLLEIHLYWSGKGSILYPSDNYGPLISAITVTLGIHSVSNCYTVLRRGALEQQ